MRRFVLLVLAVVGGCSPAREDAPRPVVVGAKKFTESILLAEMAVQLARQAGAEARRDDLGSTPTLWLALTQGDIDVYPEYTGTIAREILKYDPPDLAEALAGHGIGISRPLGFSNNYAIGMRKDVAEAYGIRTISDLRKHPNLRFGFIPEFHNRPDGWPGLRKHYDLPQTDVKEMNHTLAYRALVQKSIDAMELYTTDGEIAQHDLLALKDDRKFFPAYETVWLYRLRLERERPKVVEQLRRLEGRITEIDMQRMNGRVQVEKANEGQVAAEFLGRTLGVQTQTAEESLTHRLVRTTLEHLALVVPSLAAAMLVAIPLGILSARRAGLGRAVLGAASVLQTIPSLALLLFMIPLMKWLLDRGTGPAPAVAALFLYSLLPIVRNTVAGLKAIPPPLRESAEALGLPVWAILWRVELPLAAPTILAGIKIAAVINVGTATLGGFIGAGGYGGPILRGLDKGDVPLMLEGAIPAAVMALVVEAVFDVIERFITSGRDKT